MHEVSPSPDPSAPAITFIPIGVDGGMVMDIKPVMRTFFPQVQGLEPMWPAKIVMEY